MNTLSLVCWLAFLKSRKFWVFTFTFIVEEKTSSLCDKDPTHTIVRTEYYVIAVVVANVVARLVVKNLRYCMDCFVFAFFLWDFSFSLTHQLSCQSATLECRSCVSDWDSHAATFCSLQQTHKLALPPRLTEHVLCQKSLTLPRKLCQHTWQ